MSNAKEEILEHIGDKDVDLVRIVFDRTCFGEPIKIIEGSLSEVLTLLDFQYDSGFGAMRLNGYIWYKDGTWSERGEYDGSEWWEYKKLPEKDIEIERFY